MNLRSWAAPGQPASLSWTDPTGTGGCAPPPRDNGPVGAARQQRALFGQTPRTRAPDARPGRAPRTRAPDARAAGIQSCLLRPPARRLLGLSFTDTEHWLHSRAQALECSDEEDVAAFLHEDNLVGEETGRQLLPRSCGCGAHSARPRHTGRLFQGLHINADT